MYLCQVRNDQRPPSAGQGGLVSAVAGHIYTATSLRVTIITLSLRYVPDISLSIERARKQSLIFRIIFQLFDTVLVLLNINIDRSLFSIE